MFITCTCGFLKTALARFDDVLQPGLFELHSPDGNVFDHGTLGKFPEGRLRVAEGQLAATGARGKGQTGECRQAKTSLGPGPTRSNASRALWCHRPVLREPVCRLSVPAV